MTTPPKHFDIIIVGAGPAGTSCALALKNSNLNILLLDKDSFPRDKVCGDAIGGRSVKTLEKLAPELVKEIRNFERKEFTVTTRVFVDNQMPFNLYWKNEAFCMRRIDFDALLLKHAIQNCSTLTFEANFKVDALTKAENKIFIGNKITKTYYSANIVIAADGSQSFLAKQLVDLKLDPSNFTAAVRAYYTNVEGLLPNQTEIHVYKGHMPGYLWIFPLGNDTANIGFGMLSIAIAKRKINLKQSLTQILADSPQLAKRFQNAKMEGTIKGFGLAMGSKKVKRSGDNFMLIGDAASLIDPKSGDGISNAIESGMIAASTAMHAHKMADFSEGILKKYESDLHQKIGHELLISTIILKLGTYFPFAIRMVPTLMKSKWLIRLVKRIVF